MSVISEKKITNKRKNKENYWHKFNEKKDSEPDLKDNNISVLRIELNENYSKMAKLVYSMCVLVAMVTLCSGSAIPMWEFLGRTEKVNKTFQ